MARIAGALRFLHIGTRLYEAASPSKQCVFGNRLLAPTTDIEIMQKQGNRGAPCGRKQKFEC